MSPELRALADQAVAAEPGILRVFERVRRRNIGGMQIRTHGDYHLGQVLYTGSDFVIIDFEGEPARAISERRLKRPPLRDVAGMLRSFHYAAQSALHPASSVFTRPEDTKLLEAWGHTWTHWVSAAYLESYVKAMQGINLVPDDPEDVKALLDGLLLEKALYEVAYELNNRPDWLAVPLNGVLSLVNKD
jgi:maltose alpha-D-glucosyltransferase/alpha-amylase